MNSLTAFRSLRGFNYRTWALGAIVSNVGTWMQRTAQDWLVLTQLTHHNATAVGIVMGLQFGPQALLLPITGFAADHLDRRKLLFATQAAMGALALGLGLLTVSGRVQLWHVYLFALLLGCVAAFDAPARQTFVSDLVAETELSNAVALNSTSFNAARLIGPALAGVLIGGVGTGPVFLINAASFMAVLGSLSLLRVSELRNAPRAVPKRGSLAEGFRYVWGRPDLRAILLMLFLVGTFGLNFPIFIATMSVRVFHAGASQYGLLTSIMAIGSVVGALLSAARAKPRIAVLLVGATVFGLGLALAAVMPNYALFGCTLVLIGVAAQTFTTTVNSAVQLSTAPAMRGRVVAILLAIALGGTPIGAPIVGWVADRFGPRWALTVGAASGLVAALVGLQYLSKYRRLRLLLDAGWPRLSFDEGFATAPSSDSSLAIPAKREPEAMPATALDPKTALVVIDLQKGLAAYPLQHPFQQVVGNAARLASAFRERKLPVVLVTVGADGTARAAYEHGYNVSFAVDAMTDIDPQRTISRRRRSSRASVSSIPRAPCSLCFRAELSSGLAGARAPSLPKRWARNRFADLLVLRVGEERLTPLERREANREHAIEWLCRG